MFPLVSVIIPTYNRKKDILNCVESVKKSTYPNIEVIVIDNASTDGTKEAIQDSIFWGRENFYYYQLSSNLMAAGGRNVGISKAKGTYLLFIDSDNIIDKDMISNLVDAMEQNPQIGLIGPLMLYYKQQNMIWFINNSINRITSRTTYYYQNNLINFPIERKIVDTDHIPNVMMTRKEVELQIGGFDPTYYIMYEEADFAARIRKVGYQIKVLTSAVTYHNIPLPNEETENEMRKLGCDNPNRTFHFSKNRSIYMRKFAAWYGKALYFCIFQFMFAFYYSGIALRNGRRDIAKAWWNGLLKGMFIKIKR